MDIIPIDILRAEILAKLGRSDLCRVRLVCKLWATVVDLRPLKAPGLTEVDLSGCLGVDDGQIEYIVATSPNLRAITLTGCKKVTANGVRKLVMLTKLEALSLRGWPDCETDVVDGNEYLFMGMYGLKKLDLRDTKWPKLNACREFGSGLREADYSIEWLALDCYGMDHIGHHFWTLKLKHLILDNYGRRKAPLWSHGQRVENVVEIMANDSYISIQEYESFANLGAKKIILTRLNYFGPNEGRLLANVPEVVLIDCISVAKGLPSNFIVQ
jgi:F-box domain